MLLLRALEVAALATVVLASNSNAQCSSIRRAISLVHAEKPATSFCSSFLSIGTKTVTDQKKCSSTTQAPTTVRSTVTPKTTVTSVVTSTSAPQVVLTSTTVTSFDTVTISSTSTLTSSSVISRTVTSTVTSASTATTSETSITTAVSVTTSTTTVFDTNFACFTSAPLAKRSAAQTGLPQGWWSKPVDYALRKQVSSACSCLSICSKTATVACKSTGIAAAPAPPGPTVTSITTAPPTTIVVTSTTFTTLPVRTSTITSTVRQQTSTTTTLTVSTSSVSTTTFTTVTTVTTTGTTTVQVPSTTTSVSTSTATKSIGSDLEFRITTPNNGNNLFAAAAVSGPPYNFFYFRTQSSGATTYKLDDNCQLLETFAGVYAQQKPSDPNPGIVFSGSGVPVSCQLNLATNGLDCTNPGGGDQTFLCDTTFGANTYPLWWLGENNSPGSRCRTAALSAQLL